MTTGIYNRRILFTAALAAVMFIFNGNLSAMNPENDPKVKNSDPIFSEREIKDLINGIESENIGLKKSSIYFAGLYEIEEAVNPLIDQLGKTKDTGIKILIALSLYKIGDEEGLAAIEKLSGSGNDMKARNISHLIIKEFETKFLKNH